MSHASLQYNFVSPASNSCRKIKYIFNLKDVRQCLYICSKILRYFWYQYLTAFYFTQYFSSRPSVSPWYCNLLFTVSDIFTIILCHATLRNILCNWIWYFSKHEWIKWGVRMAMELVNYIENCKNVDTEPGNV